MATISFDVASFRAQFPGLFPDPPNTDSLINTMWDAATCYVSADTAGPMSAECRRQVLNLVTAHLISLLESAQAGNQPGFVVSASIDGISVSIQAPPSRNEFQFFLNQTIFGIQAYAMLYAAGVGGSYLGGFNELGSFRRAGGVFTPPSGAGATLAPSVCPSLVVPPLAPYTTDYGLLTPPQTVAQSVSILANCGVFSASFDAAIGDAVTLTLWTGIAIDSNQRFNLYYWDADDRAANNPATSISKGINPTGATSGSGFSLSGITAGNAGSNPNLVVITGGNFSSTEILNLSISVA